MPVARCDRAGPARRPQEHHQQAHVKVGSTKSGTSKKPKAVSFNLGITGGTKNGQGQPASSTSLNTTLPSGFKINSKSWPDSKSCDLKKMRAQKSFKAPACPKGVKPVG